MNIKAHVSGEEVRQLNEAGISAQKYLVDAFNLTSDAFDDLKKTGITGTQAMRAILEGMANDPKFAGQMEQKARLFSGLWSTVKDNMKEIMGGIGDTIFVSVNGWMNDIAKLTTKLVASLRAGGLAQAMIDFLPDEWVTRLNNFSKTLSDLGGIFSVLGGVAIEVLSGIGAFIIDAINAVDRFATMISDNLTPAFTTLGTTSDPVLNAIFGSFKEIASWFSNIENVAYAAAAAVAAYNAVLLINAIRAKEAAFWEGILAIAKAAVINPALGVALAVGGATLALANYSSSEMKSSVQNAADFYCGNFDQVADHADSATRAIMNMTRAQLQAAQGPRGEYEDSTGRLMATMKDGGGSKKSYLNHQGTPSIPAGEQINKGAQDAANRLENVVNRMQVIRDTIQEKTLEIIGTKPQVELKKLDKQIDTWEKDIVKAEQAGYGGGEELRGLIAKYKDQQEALVKYNHEKAKIAFSNETNTLEATNSRDKMAQFKAIQEAALTELANKKRDVWKKEGYEETEITRRYTEEQKKIQQAYYESVEEFTLKDLEDSKEIEQKKLEIIEASNNDKMVSLRSWLSVQKSELESQISYWKEQANNTEKLVGLYKQLETVMKSISDNPLTKEEGVSAGLKKIRAQFKTEGEMWRDMMTSIADGMTSALEDGFFSLLQGKFEGLRSLISNIITEIQKSLAKLWAQQAMQAVMGSSGGNWLTSILGGIAGGTSNQTTTASTPRSNYRASGGSVQAGIAYGYNELGREVFVPSVNGYVLNHEQTRSAMSARSGPAVIMNVYAQDAGSFNNSRGQILSKLNTSLSAAGRWS